MRAQGHWDRLNQRNFVLMHECDFTKPALPASESPSYYFRMDARYHEFNRYFSFLFQMIIKICRVWRPTRKQVKHYGVGVQTPARTALLIHHSGQLPENSVLQLNSLKRYLTGRVARESEGLKAFEDITANEAKSDMIMSCTYRILDHVTENILPMVKNGTLPKLNLKHDAISQYDHCWTVRLQRNR